MQVLLSPVALSVDSCRVLCASCDTVALTSLAPRLVIMAFLRALRCALSVVLRGSPCDASCAQCVPDCRAGLRRRASALQVLVTTVRFFGCPCGEFLMLASCTTSGLCSPVADFREASDESKALWSARCGASFSCP